jgi:hypothetical protein
VHTTLEAPQTKQTILKPVILGLGKSTIGRNQLRLKAKPTPRGPALPALWFLCCEQNNSSLPLFLKREVSLKEPQQLFSPEFEYFSHISPHKQTIYERPTRHRISHAVQTEGSVISPLKRVLMTPKPIRASDLIIHESMRRFPNIYSGLPPQGNAVKPDPIVDQSTFSHLDRIFCKNLESQKRRRNNLQIVGIAKEVENLFQWFWKPNFRIKE